MTARKKSGTTRKKRAAKRSGSGTKRRTSAQPARRRPPTQLFGILSIVCGFVALHLLRTGGSLAWDAGAQATTAVAGVTLLGWIVLQGAAGERWVGNSTAMLAITVAFLGGFGVLIQHRVKGIDLLAPSLSDLAYPAGIILMLVLLHVLRGGRYRWLALPGDLYAIVSIAGMLALLALGARYRGAVYAAGRMTPSELLKPTLAIYASVIMIRIFRGAKRKGRKRPSIPWGHWFWFGAVWGLLMALLAYQRDLGMMVILNGMLVFVLFAATSAVWILPAAAVGAAVAIGGATFVLPYVRQRVAVWLNPFSQTTGGGWQLLQSLAALYNGGLFGAGFGDGSPQAIPVASSDFIYAAIGEEFGWIGCAALVVVLGLLIASGFRIASTCKDQFGSLLATALTSVLAIQVILNLGGVTKAIPLTGVPLPFLSHGGTNLLVSFSIVGILGAIAASTDREPKRKPRR